MPISRTRLFPPARAFLTVVAIVFAIGGCSLNVDVYDPSVVIKESGDNQSQPPNTQLQPFVVLVTDQFGKPLPNVTVIWTITSGGGSLSESSNRTSDGGLAPTTYTTGPTPGEATVLARVKGVPGVTFFVTIT